MIEVDVVEIANHVTAQFFALLKANYYSIIIEHVKYTSPPYLKDTH